MNPLSAARIAGEASLGIGAVTGTTYAVQRGNALKEAKQEFKDKEKENQKLLADDTRIIVAYLLTDHPTALDNVKDTTNNSKTLKIYFQDLGRCADTFLNTSPSYWSNCHATWKDILHLMKNKSNIKSQLEADKFKTLTKEK